MNASLSLRQLVERDRNHDCAGIGRDRICVRIAAEAALPTRFGDFRIIAFYNNRDGKEHVALTHGDIVGAEDVLTRLHSECLTGDALGSVRCDCRDQLESALLALAAAPRSLLIYMRQEGRGIGLLNKIRAYALQDQGLDTVEANLALGFGDDEREYAVAAHIVHSLEVRSIGLMTNNPSKLRELERFGVRILRRVAHQMPSTPENQQYLATKRDKSGHLLENEP